MKNSELHRVDVIIVLGHPIDYDSSPNDILVSRIEKGIELVRYGYASNILFTGGGEPNAAQVMNAYAQESSVPENKIYLEEQSTTTLESAVFSTDIMAYNRWESAIVVTSPYHLRRTRIIFSKFGYDVLFVKAEYPEGTRVLTRLKDIIHELFSYVMGAY